LEQACQVGDPGEVLEARLLDVEACLEPVLAALSGLLESTASGASAASPDKQPPGPEFQTQLNELKQLLADSDAAAVDLLRQLQGQSPERGLAEKLKRVAQQVERFDFDQALELLQDVV